MSTMFMDMLFDVLADPQNGDIVCWLDNVRCLILLFHIARVSFVVVLLPGQTRHFFFTIHCDIVGRIRCSRRTRTGAAGAAALLG